MARRKIIPWQVPRCSFLLGACLALCACRASAPQPGADAPRPQAIQLGYCPTMEAHATRIGSKVPSVTPKRLATAGRVLEDLRGGGSGAILIGRLARASELDGLTVQVRLGSGHTLIRREAGFVEYAALGQMRVHTAADPAVVAKLLPQTTAVVRHPSVAEAIRLGLDEAVLISWDDFRDEHQLLIPVESGAKVEAFRLPTLYHRREISAALVQEMVRAFKGQ